MLQPPACVCRLMFELRDTSATDLCLPPAYGPSTLLVVKLLLYLHLHVSFCSLSGLQALLSLRSLTPSLRPLGNKSSTLHEYFVSWRHGLQSADDRKYLKYYG